MHRSLIALLLASLGFTGCIIDQNRDCWEYDSCSGSSSSPSPPPATGPYAGGNNLPAAPGPGVSPGAGNSPDAGVSGNAAGTKWDCGTAMPGDTKAPPKNPDSGSAEALASTVLDGGSSSEPHPDALVPCYDAGVCGKPSTPLCTFNRECGPGGRCANGECQRACATQTECGTGATCQMGFCQTATVSGKQCLFASECGAGAACINGFCHAGCKADIDCPNHADACVAGLCHPDLRPTPECRANRDCPQGQECVNAACRTPCGSDDNCGVLCSGTKCSNGFCVNPQELAPQCGRDSECGAGHACVDAICL
jgi:hypothetical protein